MRRRDVHKFPVGKARYENLGIVVFASIMGTAALQVVIESVRDLTNPARKQVDLTAMTVGVLIGVVVTKFVLWVWCFRLRKASASCEALAQDHINDVMTNVG